MRNKVLTILLSLAIAFGMWIYVVTVISPESEAPFYNVPVELVGTDYLDAHNLILTSDTKGLKMDLTLSGNRADLRKLNSANITIIADLSTITRPGEHQLPCTVSFQSGAAEVIEQSPEYITVVVAEQETKTIPVKVIYTGSVRTGYEANKDITTMDHTSVTIKGPKETVEQISYAAITVDLTDRTIGFKDDYKLTLYGTNSRPLVNDQFVTMNVEEVTAAVEIYKVKKINLNYVLDYKDSGLLEDMVTLTATKEVTLIGNDDALEKLDAQFMNDQFTFDIKLSDYKKTTSETLTLPLPDGVKCKEEIKAYIKLPTMKSIKLQLTTDKFTMDNVSQGLNVQIPNKTIVIEIWGPEEELAKITAADVRATVDCSKVNAYSSFAPVRYTVMGYEYLRIEQTTVAITVVEE